MQTPYTEIFRSLQPAHDPRHIEAYVRIEYGTLDHLTRSRLRNEAKIAVECIKLGGVAKAEQLAQSYGL